MFKGRLRFDVPIQDNRLRAERKNHSNTVWVQFYRDCIVSVFVQPINFVAVAEPEEGKRKGVSLRTHRRLCGCLRALAFVFMFVYASVCVSVCLCVCVCVCVRE